MKNKFAICNNPSELELSRLSINSPKPIHHKKISRFLILLLTLFLLINTACDDYLKTQSNSIFTEQSAFSNLDFATKNVNGIYSILADGYQLYGSYIRYYQIDSDIEFSYSANDAAFNSIAHNSATSGSTSLDVVWNAWYSAIERSNICIDNLPTSPIWEGEYKVEARRLYGEAITLRAKSYFELISAWGDVPFKKSSTQKIEDAFIPKTDRDSIYEYLIKDLKDIEDYLPWMTNTSERITKGYAKALRAQMALCYAGYSLRNKTLETKRGRHWQDYYKIARQECLEIMNSGKHNLNPSFENIFRNLHTYSMDLTQKEILFEVAFGRLITGTLCRTVGMPFALGSTLYGGAYTSIYTPPNYFYSFDRIDKRRNVSVELYNYNMANQQQLISASGLGCAPCKWRRNWIVPSMGGALKDAGNTGVNWPMMRYADVVLMFAESENEINGSPTPEAKAALSLIRKRAFSQENWPVRVDHYVDSVSVSKESFFNAIVDERAWEFGGGELVRKRDLIRWNLFGTKIEQMKNECIMIIEDNLSYKNHDKIPTFVFWKRNADNERIDILNPDYRITQTTVTGYTRSTWWAANYNAWNTAGRATFNLYFSKIANGYDKTKNNHLLPISENVITASRGMLKNDQNALTTCKPFEIVIIKEMYFIIKK